MVAPCTWNGLPQSSPGDLSCDLKHSASFSTRNSICTDVFLLEWKYCLSNCNLRWNLCANSDRCSLLIPSWGDHSTCMKCRFSAGLCSVDIHNPCEICRSWSLVTWGRLRKSLRDARIYNRTQDLSLIRILEKWTWSWLLLQPLLRQLRFPSRVSSRSPPL